MFSQIMLSQKIHELVRWVADSYPEVVQAKKEGRQITEREYTKLIDSSLLLLACTFVDMVEARKEDIEKLFDNCEQLGNC